MANKSSQKKTEIVPLYDRVLILEIDETEEKTVSGIFLTEGSGKDKGAKKGKVVAVGTGKIGEDGKAIPMTVKKGDIVLFGWGDQCEVDGEEYTLVRESEISAIIR